MQQRTIERRRIKDEFVNSLSAEEVYFLRSKIGVPVSTWCVDPTALEICRKVRDLAIFSPKTVKVDILSSIRSTVKRITN